MSNNVGAQRVVGSLRLGLSRQIASGSAPGKWEIGGPEAIRQGATLLIGRDHLFLREVILVKKNKRRELRAFPEQVKLPIFSHLIQKVLLAAVMELGAETRTYLYPFIPSTWSGFQKSLDALDGIPGGEFRMIRLKHLPEGGEGGFGDRAVAVYDVRPEHKALIDAVKWPEEKDVDAAIKAIDFEQFLELDVGHKIDWEAYQKEQQAEKA